MPFRPRPCWPPVRPRSHRGPASVRTLPARMSRSRRRRLDAEEAGGESRPGHDSAAPGRLGVGRGSTALERPAELKNPAGAFHQDGRSGWLVARHASRHRSFLPCVRCGGLLESVGVAGCLVAGLGHFGFHLRHSLLTGLVGVHQVLRWVERGDLEAVRFPGGRLRISQTAWKAFLAEHSTTSGARTLASVDEGGE